VSYSWFIFTGKIYVTGGTNDPGVFGSVEVYDPEANQWTSISPMLSPHARHSCVAFHGNLYVVGKNLRYCE
jgi:N-acetylneuraminic acid mutarotase